MGRGGRWDGDGTASAWNCELCVPVTGTAGVMQGSERLSKVSSASEVGRHLCDGTPMF